MSVSNIRRLNYRFTEACPTIPINFLYKDGTSTQIFNDAILDSGSAGVAIPLSLAAELELELTLLPDPAQTAGGEVDAFATTADFNIGRAGVFVNYTDVDICALDTETRVLIGMHPVFEDFLVTIDGHNKKFTLEPRV